MFITRNKKEVRGRFNVSSALGKDIGSFFFPSDRDMKISRTKKNPIPKILSICVDFSPDGKISARSEWYSGGKKKLIPVSVCANF